MDDCKVVIHDGFKSTWDHVRSLSNPDKLMDDCEVVIQDGLVSTSAHVISLLKLVRLMTNCVDETHAGRDWMSNYPKSLFKPERATRFWIVFSQVGMELPVAGIFSLSHSSV